MCRAVYAHAPALHRHTQHQLVLALQEAADQGMTVDQNSATRAIDYRQALQALTRWREQGHAVTTADLVRVAVHGSQHMHDMHGQLPPHPSRGTLY